jgi:hypothetical protein
MDEAGMAPTAEPRAATAGRRPASSRGIRLAAGTLGLTGGLLAAIASLTPWTEASHAPYSYLTPALVHVTRDSVTRAGNAAWLTFVLGVAAVVVSAMLVRGVRIRFPAAMLLILGAVVLLSVIPELAATGPQTDDYVARTVRNVLSRTSHTTRYRVYATSPLLGIHAAIVGGAAVAAGGAVAAVGDLMRRGP